MTTQSQAVNSRHGLRWWAGRIGLAGCLLILGLGAIIWLAGCSAGAQPAKAQVSAASVEGDEVQVETEMLISTAAEPETSQVTPPQNGPTLLEDHCASCHNVSLLAKSKKPLATWEMTLARMERLGVKLSEAEKVVLLDYLANPNEP